MIDKVAKINLTDRKEYYNSRVNKRDLEIENKGLKKVFLGTIAGFKIYIVDGNYVRDKIDTDFTNGGNPARYAYIPPNTVWIDWLLVPKDSAACILHEIVEYISMRRDGLSYDRAHDMALLIENRLRRKEKEDDVEKEDIITLARQYLVRWLIAISKHKQ